MSINTQSVGAIWRATLLSCAVFVSGHASASPTAVGGADPAEAIAPKLTVSGSDHAVGFPLRDYKLHKHRVEREEHEVPNRRLPIKLPAIAGLDTVRQASTDTSPLVSTSDILNFAGLGQGDYGFNVQYAPPDTNGAIGTNYYLQWVNATFAFFDKNTSAILYYPIAGNEFFYALGSTHPCYTNNDGDPIAQFDKVAKRWVVGQFTTSSPYYECVAVSATDDPTGAWYAYAFQQPEFPDYPKISVWPDAYYVTFNMFAATFDGGRVCALDRTSMLAGSAASQICFQLSNAFGGLLTSDQDGLTPPPAGSPNYVVNYGTNRLNLWKFFTNWASPTASHLDGPTPISVASFSPACNGGTCIVQPGTPQKLDSLADRVMYRFAYRNRGGTESLLLNHSITSGNSVGVRWYELRVASQTPSLYQQGTFAPDSNYRWMGSLAMDKIGDIALGYTISSRTVYPTVAYTGRAPGDTLGTMQAEKTVASGAGSQTVNLSRWGDYSAMTIDPVDDCTFWYTQEYLETRGTFNWSTRINSFKFPACN